VPAQGTVANVWHERSVAEPASDTCGLAPAVEVVVPVHVVHADGAGLILVLAQSTQAEPPARVARHASGARDAVVRCAVRPSQWSCPVPSTVSSQREWHTPRRGGEDPPRRHTW
jgi:hypothetical protein